MEDSRVDWRQLRNVELKSKGDEFARALQELQLRHGVRLKPIIVVSQDGTQATAQLTVELIV